MATTEYASPGNTGRSMRIEVGGRVLTVRSDASEARVEAVVRYVNERLNRIREQSQAVSSDQVVLLTALNMAEELFALKDRHQALKTRVKDRSERLLDTLNQLAHHAPTAEVDEGS